MPAMKTEAYLSADRKYRYWLLRVWDDSKAIMGNFGVNPSTADEMANDPTIRKDIGFATRLGFGGLLKLNVAAYRSTDPRKLKLAEDPFGPENYPEHLREYVQKFGVQTIVAAWGKNGNYFPGRCARLRYEFPDMMCFGRNPDGTPRHTLMLPYTTQLEKFARAGAELAEKGKP